MAARANNSVAARSCFYLCDQCCVLAFAGVPLDFEDPIQQPIQASLTFQQLMHHGSSSEHVENYKWLPGFCSLPKLISTSRQLTGSNEELSLERGVEHDSDTAQYWKRTWKHPPAISNRLRNQNEIFGGLYWVWWVQKGYISKTKRTNPE